MKKFLLAILMLTAACQSFASVYYVAPTGLDVSPGTFLLPFQTIKRAQQAVVPGDTVYIRGGNYIMTEPQIETYYSIWAYVNNINKSGTAGKRINYWAYPGERPVFDFSNIKPANYRINAFEVSASWIHFKGIEVVGVQVTITNTNTQSICFANDGGSNNIYENLSMHDGQAIGFYLTKGSNNLILNCDAYRNNDYTSQSGGGINGGNVDGFGNHPAKGSVNNVYKGCRAWFNSDDGYDCISAHETTVFDSCWAFYNGYAAGFISRGDGNGFKAGGYGSTAFTSLPTTVPRNTIRFCLSVRNKANGFYSNHHLSGSDWFNNTAYWNASNFNMLNRKDKNDTDYLTDVPGYDHVLKNNISYSPRTAGNDIVSYDASRCTITNNTFLNPGITVSSADFQSLDTSLLTAPRQEDGSLPTNGFMRLKSTSGLIDKGVDVGFPFVGAAPDLGCFEYAAPAMPVEMVGFTASAENNNVTLKWQVATEANNKGWEIQRRASNGTWQAIGFVQGKGNSTSITNYSFTDKNVGTGKYEYRLKQEDNDGRSIFSAVRIVEIGVAGKLALSVFPSPVITKATINYNLPGATNASLQLFSATGSLVATLANEFKPAGSFKTELPSDLLSSPGLYILRLKTSKGEFTRTFIKGK